MGRTGPGASVVSLGVHLIDILARPVTALPQGQAGELVEEIRLTAAGTAAGTSVDLAKLGVSVAAVGAIGDDHLGDLLTAILRGYGIDTTGLARKPGSQTSATVLPIRPNGDRPSLHARGVSRFLELGDVDLDAIASAEILHVGGPDALGRFSGEPLLQILRFARGHATTITMDLLGPGSPRLMQRLAPLLSLTDYLMPNGDQLSGLAGAADPVVAALGLLGPGLGAVIATTGAAGSFLCTRDRVLTYPAFGVSVVDTTGCGDAYSAGVITALLRGWGPEGGAWLGAAAAGLVAGGLGSDAGIVDLPTTLEFLAEHAPAAAARLRGTKS